MSPFLAFLCRLFAVARSIPTGSSADIVHSHDWSDKDCVSILKNISLGAKPTSKILVIDHVAAPAIVSRGYAPSINSDERDDLADHRHIELDDLTGAADYTTITAPPFIPKNFGAYAYMPVALGTHLMGAFNARERSLVSFVAAG